MASSGHFKRLFQGVEFRNIGDVLRHADEISRQIPVKPPALKSRPLSAFQRKVLRIAPRFLAGQYQRKQIARELLARQGVSQPLAEQLEKTSHKVGDTLRSLKRRRLITPTNTQDRQRMPSLRRVSSGDVQKNMGLVYAFLKYKVGKFSRNWQQFLSRREAVAACMRGLHRALETRDPAKGTLATHAFFRMGGEISREVRWHRRAALRTRSLSFVDRSGRALEEKIGSREIDPEALETDISWLFKHPDVERHHLILWTLYRVYGYSSVEIAKHFDVSGSAISFQLRRLKKLLKAQRV